jgi:hypothetical protein
LVEQRPGDEANDREQLGEKDLLFGHASLDGYQTPDVGVGRWGRCRYGCDQTEQRDSQVVAQRFVTCHEIRRESDVMRRALYRE